MEPSSSTSTDDGLDSFFMSLAIGPDGKTLKTGLLRSSWDAAKIMQDGITQNSPKLFARGFESHVNQVLYGIEPKNEGSCKEEKEEERKSKFLHRFEAKEKGCGDEDIKAFFCRQAQKEKIYKIDLADIATIGEDEDPSVSVLTDDSLESFFMSLAIGPGGKTLETGLRGSSWDAAKIMQESITQSSPKLFDAHVHQVPYGIEPKNEDSRKEERESKFLHQFEAKEKGRGDEDVGERIKAFPRRQAQKEETYKINLADISKIGEDEDLVHNQK
ncbi:uncharacterized protein [Elaeis guineensis]|uniref:uncharacterized protein n=1 Tax=Elaeis guineensis var. tenera TaxID=51953 RepID=UPI003C6CEC95